jgi:hypothetical protein
MYSSVLNDDDDDDDDELLNYYKIKYAIQSPIHVYDAFYLKAN